MRHLRLSTFLIAINVGLILLAVGGVAIVAVRLLQQLADEQVLARVTQANVTARQEIAHAGEHAHTNAQLLSERATMRNYLQANDLVELRMLLTDFQRVSQLNGCAIVRDGQLVANSGADLPWTQLAARQPNPEYFLYRSSISQPLAIIAQSDLPTESTVSILVATQLDDTFTRSLSDELGLKVTIQNSPNDPSSDVIAARRDDLASYQASATLYDPSGKPLGVITTALPTSSINQSFQQFLQTLMLLATVMVGIGTVLSVLVGRLIGQPLQMLTDAAARIGQGDLDTPIPTESGGEIGALATTLEDMRWYLLHLTADLRRRQSESQAIITGIVEGVFSVDRERRIRYVNPQAATLLGLSEQELIGRFCGDVLNPQGADGMRPCAEHCPIVHARFRNGAHATEYLQLHNGARRTVVITSAPFADAQQVQIIRDETEMEATRRLRDTVLSNISHEFRTPLSAQLASIELLLDQLPYLTTDQIGQLVLSLQRGTLRLTQLIDNLLESARIEAGRNNIRQRPVAIDEVVENALELTRPLLQQRNQELLINLPFPFPVITGDARLLTQVFVNLLANANKFAPAKTTIQIGGTTSKHSIELWVEDQGPGLPADHHGTLFGRFMRSNSEEPEQSGVGLGLWIVQSIIERHQGQIKARNTGNGTRITITLPITPPKEIKDEDSRRR